jgi:DNA-directed RNA polymerase specialized sigma24 family protein
VQEGFARALRDRAQFRGEGSLEGWVWRIAFRAALQQRRNGRERTLDEALADVPDFEVGRDPELARALRGLPPRRRLIVFLRYFATCPTRRSQRPVASARGRSPPPSRGPTPISPPVS